MNLFAERKTRVAAVVAAAAAATMSLTACSSDGVMHDGSVGASSGDVSVSSADLERTTNEVNAIDGAQSTDGNQQATAGVLAPYVVLAPKLDALARRYGLGVSDSQIRSEVLQRSPGAKMSATTVDAYRSSHILNLVRSGMGPEAFRQQALNTVRTAKIDINPRFGSFSSGQFDNAYNDWTTYQKVDAADLGSGGGRQPN